MTPWLSVVVPVHDGERWLGETFDSLVAQESVGIECLVIDSSPGEGTATLAASYADRLSLRILRRPDLAHWRAKTNAGFREARADHVAMLHQDDVWLPGRAVRVKAWLAQAPQAAMHLHPSRVIDAAGRPVGTWRCPLPPGDAPLAPGLLFQKLMVQNFIAVPAPVIRRDAFAAVGGLREDLWYTGDWDLYLKLARHGDAVYHSDVLTGFRVHAQSMTVGGSRDAAEFAAQMRTVLAAHAGDLPAAVRASVLRQAEASLRVNCGLAAASRGSLPALLRAAFAILALGPRRIPAFLRDTRLLDRVLPRLRAGLLG
ncbi:glycosyltransferase [uncultured Methylobacterium sp.]|uniref:glycosyltransferase n=1 Tax=uncultured Methylobacterium sp. TaxID=157278 RepID=UPI0035CC0E21